MKNKGIENTDINSKKGSVSLDCNTVGPPFAGRIIVNGIEIIPDEYQFSFNYHGEVSISINSNKIVAV